MNDRALPRSTTIFLLCFCLFSIGLFVDLSVNQTHLIYSGVAAFLGGFVVAFAPFFLAIFTVSRRSRIGAIIVIALTAIGTLSALLGLQAINNTTVEACFEILPAAIGAICLLLPSSRQRIFSRRQIR